MGNRSPLFSRHQPGGVFTILDATELPGNIWFVDSNSATGADSDGYGQNPDAPFLSIDYAIGKCEENNGDVIIAMPGHVEVVSAPGGLDLDKEGITIVFRGEGDGRACVTFTTSASADMDVDADNITLINPRFVAGIDGLTGPIDVNKAHFTIKNGEWYDAAEKQAVDCIVADANADYLVIDGWRFFKGTAGAQAQSNIQIAGATRPILRNIDIVGDFATGPIENGTAWIDALLENVHIDSQNATPKVGILLQGTSSGSARKVHIRVASGSTYITADNDMQWFECYGTGTDATGAEEIGTMPSGSVEGKLDTLIAEIGSAVGADISTDIAAIKAQTDELGSAVGASLSADIAAVKAVVDAQPKTAVYAQGICDAGMVASTTVIVSDDLVGHGDDYFNGHFWLQVLHNTNSAGNAPEHEVRLISDYVSLTGTFTTAAFSQNVETGDIVLVLHESVVAVGRNDAANAFDSSAVVADDDGSALERLEFVQGILGTPIGADLATDIAALVTQLGTPAGADLAADIAAIVTLLGTPAGADIAADIAALVTLLGTPAGADLVADITALSTLLGTPAGADIAADIAAIVTLLGTPAGADLAADIAALVTLIGTPAGADVIADIANILTAIGTPVDTDISTDIANLQGDVTAIKAVTDALPDAGALTTMKGVVDDIKAAGGLGSGIARKSVTFSNTSSDVDLFTVTGDVIVRLVAICGTNVVSTGGCNVLVKAGATDLIVSTDATLLAAGDIWHDATPDASVEDVSVLKSYMIANGLDIVLDVQDAKQLDSGVMNFYCFWTALSANGAVVPAA